MFSAPPGISQERHPVKSQQLEPNIKLNIDLSDQCSVKLLKYLK